MQTDLEKAWTNVQAAGRAMPLPSYAVFDWGAGCDARQHDSDCDLLEWVDRLETRLRADAANLREAVLCYIAIRCNGEGIDPENYHAALASIQA